MDNEFKQKMIDALNKALDLVETDEHYKTLKNRTGLMAVHVITGKHIFKFGNKGRMFHFDEVDRKLVDEDIEVNAEDLVEFAQDDCRRFLLEIFGIDGDTVAIPFVCNPLLDHIEKEDWTLYF